jgi:hypothetical protein
MCVWREDFGGAAERSNHLMSAIEGEAGEHRAKARWTACGKSRHFGAVRNLVAIGAERTSSNRADQTRFISPSPTISTHWRPSGISAPILRLPITNLCSSFRIFPNTAERRSVPYVALTATESSRGAGQSPSRPRRRNARLVAIQSHPSIASETQ